LVVSGATCRGASFEWQDASGETTLLYDGRPALRYMHAPLDESSEAKREGTIKPYHHVWGPAGEQLLTKGPGGLYTHHRGLFFGFNKITYHGDREADVWHCRNGESQRHEAELEREAAENRARHRVRVGWHGRDGERFAVEERECAITRTTHDGVACWQIDFASHVATADGRKIRLDGDPQHAGFHFRAAQEDIRNDEERQQSADKQIYFVRTDGKGALGETRNWDPKEPDSPASANSVNRPWLAMSFLLDGNRYTVLYLDHPSNPKPARYSERAYGRFGSYFEAEVTEAMPLNVKYRVWVRPGEMTVDECEALSARFNAEDTVLPSAEAAAQPKR
jgi:hypothetical protein